MRERETLPGGSPNYYKNGGGPEISPSRSDGVKKILLWDCFAHKPEGWGNRFHSASPAMRVQNSPVLAGLAVCLQNSVIRVRLGRAQVRKAGVLPSAALHIKDHTPCGAPSVLTPFGLLPPSQASHPSGLGSTWQSLGLFAAFPCFSAASRHKAGLFSLVLWWGGDGSAVGNSTLFRSPRM